MTELEAEQYVADAAAESSRAGKAAYRESGPRACDAARNAAGAAIWQAALLEPAIMQSLLRRATAPKRQPSQHFGTVSFRGFAGAFACHAAALAAITPKPDPKAYAALDPAHEVELLLRGEDHGCCMDARYLRWTTSRENRLDVTRVRDLLLEIARKAREAGIA